MDSSEKSKLRLEVVTICRNEMEFIGRMLESVKDADIIHVLDTGSTDNGETCRIARSFGDKVKVYEDEYKWQDSFCHARNAVKAKATPGVWCLSLDADEYLHDLSAVYEAIEFAEANKIRAVDILQTADSPDAQTNVFPRLFRNDPDIVWHGVAHNYISIFGTLLVKENGVIRVGDAHSKEDRSKALVNLTFGYSLTHLADPDRTLRILQKAYDEGKAGAREKFYLGREYYYRARWADASAMFGKYVQESNFLMEKAEAFLMMSHCYWNLGLGEDARDACLQCLKINPNFKESIAWMAEIVWPRHAEQWKRMARTADNSEVLFTRDIKID